MSAHFPGDERRDCVDVYDIVAGLEKPEMLVRHPPPGWIEHRSRESELVGKIELGLVSRLTADTIGGRIDPPSERPEMGCTRHEEVAYGLCHSRDERTCRS